MMTGRNVLVLPAWYPTEKEPLAGVFVRDHARAAAARGHRMIVVVDAGPSADLRRLFALSEERDERLRVFRLAYRPHTGSVSYLAGVLTVARRLAREGTPIDLLHAHVHGMGWAALLAATPLCDPFVISEHSSEWPRRMITPGALRRARIAFRRASLVCPVDDSLRQAIESYGIRATFRVVPNGVNTAVFYAQAEKVSVPPTRLVNVALHVEVKGLDVLLQAFALVAVEREDLTLELIGEGPLTSDLQSLAEQLGVGGRVRFAGRLAPNEVAKVLRSADVFVLPSLSENLPVALLEALCCGLPIVATSVGGVPTAVGADGELARPGDVEAFANALRAVLGRYEEFDRTSVSRRAIARWSQEAIGDLWDEIYRSV
jgi:glycosyltransferase involved in cell wall biosynthesis